MRLLSLGLHVLDEVDDAVGVTHLVVVPGDELDEGGGDLDSGLGVEDRGAGVAEEVGGHHGVLGVAEHALQGSLGGGPRWGEKNRKQRPEKSNWGVFSPVFNLPFCDVCLAFFRGKFSNSTTTI